MRVQDAMTSAVLTAHADDAVKDAAALLARHGYTCLPVVDGDGDLIGVVTEADVVRDQLPHDPRSTILRDELTQPPPAATVADVMTTDVRTVSPRDDVADVAKSMVGDKLRSIPVVDGGRLVGIITRRDVVRVVGRPDDEVAREIRRRLSLAFGADWRWQVEVERGSVQIADAMDDPADRHAVAVLAAAVPGVLHVEVGYRQEDGPGGMA
jgi:CBS domain-containing protein